MNTASKLVVKSVPVYYVTAYCPGVGIAGADYRVAAYSYEDALQFFRLAHPDHVIGSVEEKGSVIMEGALERE